MGIDGKTAAASGFGIIVFLLFLPICTGAAEHPLDVHETIVKEINVHREIQKSENRWAGQRARLRERYQMLEDMIEQLENRDTILTNDLKVHRKTMAEKKRSIIEMKRVQEEMQCTLETISERLSSFVANDLPFCTVERQRRVKELNNLLPRLDTSLAEKCRRTLEALQVETKYGRDLLVSAQIINTSGTIIAADVVNIGRLSLFYKAPDGERIGWYNRATERWGPLPTRYGRDINQVFEMALHRHPLETVSLPLGRIAIP